MQRWVEPAGRVAARRSCGLRAPRGPATRALAAAAQAACVAAELQGRGVSAGAASRLRVLRLRAVPRRAGRPLAGLPSTREVPRCTRAESAVPQGQNAVRAAAPPGAAVARPVRSAITVMLLGPGRRSRAPARPTERGLLWPPHPLPHSHTPALSTRLLCALRVTAGETSATRPLTLSPAPPLHGHLQRLARFPPVLSGGCRIRARVCLFFVCTPSASECVSACVS